LTEDARDWISNDLPADGEVFASGWLEGDQAYLGRPDDIIMGNDGSILVADDWVDTIYRISYSR
jgi:glucose/arabinose dehydrogenase